jgi:hypothetical protein
MEVDKGRVVRGAANCRIGTASLVPGGERPRGGPLEKAAKWEGKKDGGKMAREDWGHRRIRQNQAITDLVGEAARRRSHRRPIANEGKSARGRDESEQGAWGDWTASGGSVRQHDVTEKGRSGIQRPQTATAVTGVEGNGVQTGDKINERMENREGRGGEGRGGSL